MSFVVRCFTADSASWAVLSTRYLWQQRGGSSLAELASPVKAMKKSVGLYEIRQAYCTQPYDLTGTATQRLCGQLDNRQTRLWVAKLVFLMLGCSDDGNVIRVAPTPTLSPASRASNERWGRGVPGRAADPGKPGVVVHFDLDGTSEMAT